MKIKKDHIILVEDDPFQAKFFGKIIEKIGEELGYKAIVINSGEKLLDFIKGESNILDISREQAGLIILDLNLADISGFFILKEMQKLEERIPIVIQSADSSHVSIIKAIKLGAEDYFLKSGEKEEGQRVFDIIEEIMKG